MEEDGFFHPGSERIRTAFINYRSFRISSFSNSDKKARFKPGFHSIPANPWSR
jgi:hypothetical protein